MNLFRRKPKKLPQNSDRLLVNPEDMPNPQSVADYLRRGYAFYARSKFTEAEADFQQAIQLDPKAVDALYALGMAQKAQKHKEESIRTFEKVINLIDSGVIENIVRAHMLRRLAQGHINELNEGDWNLEKEIWRHVD